MQRRTVLLLRRAGTGRLVPAVLGKMLVLAVVSLISLAPAGAARTADSIAYTIEGVAGTNGWYRGNGIGGYVVVHWVVNIPAVSTQGCEAAVRVDGPTTGTRRTCAATLDDGTTISVQTKMIKIDADAPVGVAAAADRPPDANGWYNHPLSITWRGSDATSGIAACTSLTYPGAAGAAATVDGGCTDNAGNYAASAFGLKYDASPPTVSAVSVESKAGADIVHWASSSPTDTAVIRREARGSGRAVTVYQGVGTSFSDEKIRDDREYRYFVRTYDQAANASSEISALGLPKVLTLGKVSYVPRAAPRPILRWSKARGARYYHVQLFRRGRRILAAWPHGTTLRLRPAWRWSGRRFRLTAGRYRWYAWAGYGPRSAARYKLLGRADFIVAR